MPTEISIDDAVNVIERQYWDNNLDQISKLDLRFTWNNTGMYPFKFFLLEMWKKSQFLMYTMYIHWCYVEDVYNSLKLSSIIQRYLKLFKVYKFVLFLISLFVHLLHLVFVN